MARPLAGDGFNFLLGATAVCMFLSLWIDALVLAGLIPLAMAWYRGRQIERWAEKTYRRAELSAKIERLTSEENLEPAISKAQADLARAKQKLKAWVNAPGVQWDCVFWSAWMGERCERKPESNKWLFELVQEREWIYEALQDEVHNRQWNAAMSAVKPENRAL
jgi:hypothetical protein